jgi:hypothetical protein
MFVHKSDHGYERQSDEFKKQYEANSLGRDMCSGDVADEFRRKKRDKEKQWNG